MSTLSQWPLLVLAQTSLLCPLPPPQATAVTVRFYGLVHWEDPADESLGPVPCHCSAPEGVITKEGMLHYKAGTSYLGKEHWKTCFVVLRWESPQLQPRAPPRGCWAVRAPAERKAQSGWLPPPQGCGVDILQDVRASL